MGTTVVADFEGVGRISLMKSKQKGFAVLVLALIFMAATAVAGGVYWWQKSIISDEEQTAQTVSGAQEEQHPVIPVTSPTVALQVNTASPLPGTSVVFTSDIKGKDIEAHLIEFIGGSQFGNFVPKDDAVPYAWTINLSKTASGQRTYKVVAIVDGQPVESNSITVTVKPDLSTLRQLTFEPGEQKVLFPGSSEQLRLMGLFDDGLKRDLTQAAMGTVYSEGIVFDGVKTTPGDSPVISVSADGKVTAQQPGTADVIATNNGMTTVRRFNVVSLDELE